MLRLHDPLHRVNWGGRSTSLALAGQLAANRRQLDSWIGAEYILENLCELDDGAEPAAVLDRVDELAGRIAAGGAGSPKLTALHDMFTRADELVVNGEGDFILTRRITLCRTLVMMAAAARMGLRVHLLNSVLSWGNPRHPIETAVAAAVAARLRECRSVWYRDPESLRLHRELFPGIAADWAPDALFTWAHHAQRSTLGTRRGFAPETEGLPIAVQELLERREPYVVISGSSLRPRSRERTGAVVRALQDGLARHGVRTVFAGTDAPDLRMMSDDLDLPVVDPRVPMSAAARLLWNAEAMISGRYHPSILASLGGTPFVLMASNSHKTRSLLEVVPFAAQLPEQPLWDDVDQVPALLDFVADVRADRRATRAEVSALARRAGADARSAVRRALRGPTLRGGTEAMSKTLSGFARRR